MAKFESVARFCSDFGASLYLRKVFARRANIKKTTVYCLITCKLFDLFGKTWIACIPTRVSDDTVLSSALSAGAREAKKE